ncbi:MAG: menaquinol-cytochrome c reductase cytochrome b subunit, partial [Acidimicrobiia bacterium]|nr:menaquinol-cytochrome c reductase cytochrome b subunit [Acidimicrobiia bacterium]
ATAPPPAPAPAAPVRVAATATAPPPARTQRLLAVVKAGSIQTTRKDPVDKVNTWPHLLVIEFVALLLCSIFLIGFSLLIDAPLQDKANFNLTPNPSKAPWYFLGLQELLTAFHPMVAGVTIPGIGIFALIAAPYIDRNPATKPSERKFAIAIFTFFMMYWVLLVMLGVFFRGPGFNFILPWRDGLFFDF